MNAEKCVLRQRLRKRRRGLPAAVVEAAGAAVWAQLQMFAPYRSARAVIAYIADENEIATARVLEEVGASGRELYLPRAADGVRLGRWRVGDPLIAGVGGIPEPIEEVPAGLTCAALALTPVVGWDRAGGRLGRGGGFYDRLFASLPGEVTRVGLAYEFQEIAELSREPWDISLHYVITERRVVRCADGGVVRPALLQKGGQQL